MTAWDGNGNTELCFSGVVQISLLVLSFGPINPQELAIKKPLLQWMVCFSKLSTSFNFPKILQQAVFRGLIRVAVKQRVQEEKGEGFI